MESKTNYTSVGLIVVLLTAALIIGGLWLSVGFNQKKYTVYAVYFHEAVSGLSLESPVKFNGVQIGNVYQINLSHNDPQEVQILLNIEEGTPITTSTYATLISQGITGNVFIGLTASSSDLTPLRKLPNETYPIIPTKPSLFNQLDSVLKEVSENVNAVSVKFKEIFDKQNINNIKSTLSNLESFTNMLSKNNNNIERSLNNIADASNDLPAVIKNLKTSIQQLTREISIAGQSMTKTMDAGRVTINKINQQALPSTVTLLQHLNNVAANLEQVSFLIKQNPSVIIRGSTPPKPGPGEQNE